MFIEFFLRKISIWQKIHFLNKNEYISALKNIYSSYCLFGIYMDKHYTYFNFFDRPFLCFCIVVTGTYFMKIVVILYTVKFNCFRKLT